MASYSKKRARVVKLVDTQCSERCGRNPMGVQIPPRAPGSFGSEARAPRSHRGGQWFESTNDHIN